MWLSEGPERNVNDFHRLTHNKFKKTYFKRNPKDPKELQVIRFFFNVFTGTPQQQVSNFHAAEPEKDWVEMTPEEESRGLPIWLLYEATKVASTEASGS